MSTVDDLGIAHADGTDGAVSSFSRRAPRISQADVFRAADELLVQGDRPTIDRVRMRLGRGSPNTINDHLDAWWAKLGARLRDLPGQEFPQLPQRVAQALQNLWITALEGAHEALDTTLTERESALTEQERSLVAQSEELLARERAQTIRASAMEESLARAHEQLAAANQRAETLEAALQDRGSEAARWRTQAEAAESVSADLRQQLATAAIAQREERASLDQRHATSEQRWLMEVDRARQARKDADKRAEHLQAQLEKAQTDREQLRVNLATVRAELTASLAVRGQLEERINLLSRTEGQTERNQSPPRRLARRPDAKGKMRRPRDA